jgi:capsular polysaccharide biosynthesis protein
MVLPQEVQDQLNELKQLRNEEVKKSKFKNIVDIAKKNIRADLHNSFEKYAKTYNVALDKDDNEQAKDIANSFQEIFKDSIGDIRPYTPKQIQQQDDEIINGVKKVTL